MKKRFNFILDEESKVIVQKHLEKSGMSLSGFLNTILLEFANQIKGQPSIPDKALKDMTLEEFGNLANYWIKAASEE